jgi:hypothetical protein
VTEPVPRPQQRLVYVRRLRKPQSLIKCGEVPADLPASRIAAHVGVSADRLVGSPTLVQGPEGEPIWRLVVLG